MVLHKLIIVFFCVLSPAKSSDVETIQSKLEVLQKQLDLNTKELIDTKTELTATRNEMAQMKEKDEKRRLLLDNDDSRPVMFTAQLNSHAENLSEHQMIKFEKILTSVGSGYDNYTGVFTCPVAGKYFFTVTIMSHYENWIETELVVNGAMKMLIYSGAGSARFNQGTSSVIVALNAGDRVWVETVNTQLVTQSTAHVYGFLWSSFSGFRISS